MSHDLTHLPQTKQICPKCEKPENEGSEKYPRVLDEFNQFHLERVKEFKEREAELLKEIETFRSQLKEALRVISILNDAFSEVKDGEASGKYILNRHRFIVKEILEKIQGPGAG